MVLLAPVDACAALVGIAAEKDPASSLIVNAGRRGAVLSERDPDIGGISRRSSVGERGG